MTLRLSLIGLSAAALLCGSKHVSNVFGGPDNRASMVNSDRRALASRQPNKPGLFHWRLLD
jgi:hypothetical protein